MSRGLVYVYKRQDLKLLAGVCAGVWKDGERVLRVCMGERIPQEHAPMTENTLFRMASMTKPITGTAAMQLWMERSVRNAFLD